MGNNNSSYLQQQEEFSTSTQLQAKAISIWQPWASLISLGLKQYETRSWRTSYRGKLVICSAQKTSKQQRQEYSNFAGKYRVDQEWSSLLFGQAIAICELTDCIEITPDFLQTKSQAEIDSGNWIIGAYAWKLENIRVLNNPVDVKGQQGLWNIELDSNLSLSRIKNKVRLGDGFYQ